MLKCLKHWHMPVAANYYASLLSHGGMSCQGLFEALFKLHGTVVQDPYRLPQLIDMHGSHFEALYRDLEFMGVS